MILYHFCCKKDMRGIRCSGITKGVVCCDILMSKIGTLPEVWQYMLFNGWQWLTMDPDHDRQSWATKIKIKIDRLEYRWTVDVPDEDQLYDRDALDKEIAGTKALFDGWAGSENWRVYRGNISKYQLKKLEHWNGSGWDEVKFR